MRLFRWLADRFLRPQMLLHSLRPMPEPGLRHCRVRDASTPGFCIALNTGDGVQFAITSLIGINSGRQLRVGIRQLTANAAPVKLESVHASPGGQMMGALYLSLAGTFPPRRCVLVASAKISRHGGHCRLLSKGWRSLVRKHAPLKLIPDDYVLADFDSMAQPEAAPC